MQVKKEGNVGSKIISTALAVLMILMNLFPATASAATSATSGTGRLTIGTEIIYANYSTCYMEVDGTVAYCAQPELDTPSSGTYTKSSVTSSRLNSLRAILYYGYDGPGFEEGLKLGIWPTTWYNGDAMTDDYYYVLTHLMATEYLTGSLSDTLYRTRESFAEWYCQNVSGFNYDGELINNTTATARVIVNSLASNVPDSFQIFQINAGSTSTQTILSWVYRGDIKIEKTSGNLSITIDNDLYSLEGAVYGVYTSYSNAENDTNAVATLVTDSDGTATVEDLDASRTYYVKEKIAPDGYELDEQIYVVEITDIETTLTITEQPQITTPPDGYKRDAVTGSLTASGDGSLAGAQFTVKYYDVATEAEVSGATPLRTWVLEADENGYVALDEDHFVSGDDFYYDDDGNVVLPIGVVSWQETKAPEGYLLDDTITYIVLESSGNTQETIDTYDEPYRGGISVQKFAAEVSQSTTGTSANGIYTGADLTSVIGLNDDSTAISVEDLTVVLENAANYVAATGFDSSSIGTGGSGVTTENSTDFYAVPQAAAKFEGAEITIYNASAEAVIVDGVTYEPGDAVMTLTLDETGYAATDSDALPYGTYTLKETKAPTGYKLNTNWERTVEIREDGVIVEVTDLPEGDANTSGVDDQVIRGDYSFNKIALDTQDTLAYVPFLLVNNETGEAHVIVTDVNGEFYSTSDWNAHTYNTNANDAAITWNDDGTYTIDASLLDEYAGVWFTGYGPLNDPTGTLAQMVDPNDDLGALPYGTYTLVELSSEGNAGYVGVVKTFSVARDGVTITGGTITDANKINNVSISTLALDEDTLTHYGSATPGDTVTIIDTVTFTGGLVEGETYTFTGTLMSQTTGEAILDGEGNEITASIEHTITTDEAENGGSVEVVFGDIPYESVVGQTIIVFETLTNSDGDQVATHEDIEDGYQAVYYPVIGTTAVDDTTLEHEGDATSTDTVTIIDTVTYTGLVVGETYVMTGTLYDKTTGEAIEGTEASVEFTPDATSGTVEITFEVSSDLVLGKHVVVFEDCYYDGQLIAIHADIDDEGQTVTYPVIGTTAVDGADGDQTVVSSTESVIVDTVEYVGLTPGVEYVMVGTLYDQETGEVVDGVDPVTLRFTPETSDGYVEMTFTLDTSGLVEHTLVVFERLYHDFNADDVLDDLTEVVSTHEDLYSESQAVFIANGNVAAEEIMLSQTGNNQLLTVLGVTGATVLSAAAVYSVNKVRRKR